MIVDGKENGVTSAINPTTMVASARTVPRISPIARESSFFFIDSRAKKSSGTVVPRPTTSIPITRELTPSHSAIAREESIIKCAPTSKIVILKMSIYTDRPRVIESARND